MTRELVDLRVGAVEAEGRELAAGARVWAGSAERAERIGFYQDLMGVSEYRAAELADMARGSEVKEQAGAERAGAERAEALSAQVWMAQRRNTEANRAAGLPDGTPGVERMGLLAPTLSREVAYELADSRDPARGVVPVDTDHVIAAGVARFVTASDGFMVDISGGAGDGQAARSLTLPPSHEQDCRWVRSLAERSQRRRDAQEAGRRSFWQNLEAERAARRELATAVRGGYAPSGTGWPEITR